MSFDLLIRVWIYYPRVLIRIYQFYGLNLYQATKFDYGFSLGFQLDALRSSGRGRSIESDGCGELVGRDRAEDEIAC
ncbi:hypothetical protein Bca101_027057 [Brassica carinata]